MKIAVAVTGASGAIYAKQMLDTLASLQKQFEDISVVWSNNAFTVWREELENNDFEKLSFKIYDKNDFYAPFASGSAGYDALIICPCSMGTLARIAGGISNDLITRTADVMLKERRKLICVIREMPYNLIHINNMKAITEAGGIICAASPSFYGNARNLQDAVQTVVDRVLQLIGIDTQSFKWGQKKAK